MRCLWFLALAACPSRHDAPPSTKAHAGDAGVAVVATTGLDPEATHDDGPSYRPVVPPSNRPARPIDVTLRSTPPNAQAAVDGVPLGPTPAYWNGSADGREHEFTFVLPRHAVARYRFVPITSGVVHARLEPIGEDVDAGVPPPEVVPPSPVFVPSPPVIAPPAAPPVDAAGFGPQP